MDKEFQVKTVLFPAVRNLLFRHSRKLISYGFDPPEIENVKSVKINGVSHTLFNLFYERVQLKNGWEIIGQANFSEERSSFLFLPNSKPAPDILSVFNFPFCNHCEKRGGNSTYLLKKDSHIVQVRKGCLKDFSSKHISALLFFHTICIFDQEITDGWIGMPVIYSLTIFLGHVFDLIEEHGFVGTKEGYEKNLVPTKKLAIDIYDLGESPSEKGLDFAKKAIQYFATEEQRESSFLRKLIRISSEGAFLSQESSFAANIIPFYRQAMSHIETKNSQFLGTVGQSDVFTAKLSFVKVIYSPWGNSLLHRFVTPQGDVLSWFCNGKPLGAQSGQTVCITGKIKEHKEYRGEKITMLTHVKLQGVL